jgi:hypothetical protein
MEEQDLDFYASDTPMDGLTVQALDQLGKEIAEQSAKVGAMDEHLKGEKGKLEKMKAQMIAYLSHFGKKSYPIPGAGTFTRVEKLSYQIPKESEQKIQFLKWLRSKGEEVYLSTVTVNHNTLNAMANSEFEQAAAEGRSFSIPGLGDPKKYEMLSIRKGK